MTVAELPFRATTEQACNWLAQQTGAPRAIGAPDRERLDAQFDVWQAIPSIWIRARDN